MSESKNVVNDSNILKNQDLMQKIGMIPTVLMELYKVIVSSFLILFVPQKCDDHVCSLNENMVAENDLYTTGLVLNFITMFSFLVFYFIEVKRENRLITYLDVNSTKASDNDSVGKVLESLPVTNKENIINLDKNYQRVGWFALGMFMLNTIISGFVVYKYYLDNQTTSTYITNILFMVTKLSDIYAITNTEQNIFYSAYLKIKLQYNDVDPDKKICSKEESDQEKANQGKGKDKTDQDKDKTDQDKDKTDQDKEESNQDKTDQYQGKEKSVSLKDEIDQEKEEANLLKDNIDQEKYFIENDLNQSSSELEMINIESGNNII
jgi:hypothetical protein